MFPTARALPALLTLLALGACAPTVATRGNLISDARFGEVMAQTSTRADVQQKWGPPTLSSTLDPSVWYYVGETTEQKGVFEAKVARRRMIRVSFDGDDKVTEVTELDPKLAREIDPVDRKTSTAGKEFTALQQFVGNLGKYNSDKKKKK